MDEFPTEFMIKRLEGFDIEVPSWGFWRGGTRFETYSTGEEPRTLEERMRAAGEVHRLTGKGRKVSLHFPWDAGDEEEVRRILDMLRDENLEAGGVNANLFSVREGSALDSRLRFGSFGSPLPKVREAAVAHVSECIRWMRILGSKTLVLWIPDGSNSPGQASFFDMLERVTSCIREVAGKLRGDEMMLIEYKPFEPAAYATTVFDWGTAKTLVEAAGDRVAVLVDLGHHLLGANIEQIVAYLIKSGGFGGIHFNDRKYADDDLVAGSLDPAALFRIFCVLQEAHRKGLVRGGISFMIDQSPRIKDPLAAMVESIENILVEFLKSLLVDYSELKKRRDTTDVTGADKILRDAFRSNPGPVLNEWRRRKGLPENPLEQLGRRRTSRQNGS